MASELAVPEITRLAWGRIEVEGYPPFRDAKIYPGGARAWDWRETGTRHSPGIQPGDVAELVDHGAKVIVLSRGVLNRLRVCRETLELLRERGIDVEVLRTVAAVKRFNEFRQKVPVGGLFHSTC